MEYKQFINIMAAVGSNFETKAKTEEALNLWFEALRDLDYMTCQAAVKVMYRNHNSRFVAVADIRKAYNDILNPKIGTTEAYKLVTDTIRRFGRYEQEKAMAHIKANNPSMYRVVKSIGYQQLCNGNLEFTRGPIQKMYEAVQEGNEKNNLLGNYSETITKIRQNALMQIEGD